VLPPGRPEVARLIPTIDVGGIVQRPDGTPAVGAAVQAQSRTCFGLGNARTAADGTYRMSLRPGPGYIITVLDAERAVLNRTGVTVRAGAPNPDFALLRLTPGTVVAGRVTAGPDNRPAAGEFVYLKLLGPPSIEGIRPWLTRWARTDADGRYHIRAGAGDYEIAGPDMKFAPLTVGAEATITRDVRLPRLPRGPFEVTVRKPDESPAAGAAVKGVHLGDARTDEHGRVRATRTREPMLLYARDAAAGLAQFAVVGADDDTAALTLRPAATVTGRVVGPDGRPRPNCTITCIVQSAAHPDERLWTHVTAYPGPDGTFRVPGLADGTVCRLLVCNGMTCGVKPAKEFAVTGPGTLDLGDVPVPPDLK
jgi:hypothetical protein